MTKRSLFNHLILTLALLCGSFGAAADDTSSSAESYFIHLNGNSYSLADDETLDMNHQDQGGSTASWAFEVHDIQTRYSRRPLQLGIHVHAHDYDGVIIKAAEVTLGRQLWSLEKRNLSLNATTGLGYLRAENWFDDAQYATLLLQLDLRLDLLPRLTFNVSPYFRATNESELDGDKRNMDTAGFAFGISFKLF